MEKLAENPVRGLFFLQDFNATELCLLEVIRKPIFYAM